MKKGIILAGILAGVVGVAGLAHPVLDAWRHRNDKAYVDITLKDRGGTSLYLVKGEKEVTVDRGKPVFVYNAAGDYDGIKSSRTYVNDTLIDTDSDFPVSSEGHYPTRTYGISNGWPLDTSRECFHLGKNVLRFEVEDTKGNINSSSAIINVQG